MKFRLVRSALSLIFAASALVVLCPASSWAQNGRRTEPAMGESYVMEVQYAWWKPELIGSVTSDRLMRPEIGASTLV